MTPVRSSPRPAEPASEPSPEARELARVASDGVAWTVDGEIAWANERLAEISGRGAGVVGAKLEELLGAHELAEDAGGAPAECEIERPTGERRNVVCRCAGRDGRTAIWVIEDVTVARRIGRELLQASQELARVHRDLEALRDSARRDIAERSELLDVVSHELRTPVTVIGGYHRLLLGAGIGPLNEQQRRYLEESHKSCQRLDKFIANLLAASRAANGGEVLEVGRALLAPVIESVAEMFESLLAERGLRLVVALDPAAAEARFDPLRVEQVLSNLVGNAVKFTRTGGTIEVATRALEVPDDPHVRRWVEISVSDDGPGIASDDRERVFEPYVQLGDRRGVGGVGLGLAICRRLVEAHGGEIALGERDGGGCRFAFTLPAEPPSPIGGANAS
jgi:signal transduction histidine kinase